MEFKIASAKRQISAAIAVAQIFNSHAARAVLEFHDAPLKGKFCMTLARHFGISQHVARSG